MPNLYPTFDVPNLLDTESEKKADYKPSAFFNFVKGDFETDSNGRIIEATGVEAWEQWCLKAVYTQRTAFMSYTNGYGAEIDEAFKQPTQSQKQAYFERTITEAILADPFDRTLYVRNFVFEWVVDGVNVTFDVVGHEDKIAHIQANL